MTTLGISTNTRLLGFAVINQGSLVDYAMHLHKQSWSPSKATQIIAKLEPCVRRYCIKSVVLSIPYAYHQTKEWKYLTARIRKHFAAKGISVYSEKIETLYSLSAPQQKKTKKAFMQAVAERFPEMHYCLYKELRNKSKYYIKVFEAIAIAALHEQIA